LLLTIAVFWQRSKNSRRRVLDFSENIGAGLYSRNSTEAAPHRSPQLVVADWRNAQEQRNSAESCQAERWRYISPALGKCGDRIEHDQPIAARVPHFPLILVEDGRLTYRA
jgi:hypothetical protein